MADRITSWALSTGSDLLRSSPDGKVHQVRCGPLGDGRPNPRPDGVIVCVSRADILDGSAHRRLVIALAWLRRDRLRRWLGLAPDDDAKWDAHHLPGYSEATIVIGAGGSYPVKNVAAVGLPDPRPKRERRAKATEEKKMGAVEAPWDR